MKRIIIILIISILTLSFTGCRRKDSTPKDIDMNGAVNQEKQDEDQLNLVDEEDISPNSTNEKIKQEVILYFPDSDLMSTYRLRTTIEADNQESLPKAALEAWIKGTDYEGLTNLVKPTVIIEYVENVDGIAQVSFSKEIKESNLGSTGELMLVEQVSMIMQQFGYEQTQLLIEGKIEESLLGHLYIADPVTANDPEAYTWVEDMETSEIVVQNLAFRIFEPAPNAVVGNKITVRGVARVFEAVVSWEFEDGHEVLASGHVMASEGAPGWGEFQFEIDFDKVANNNGTIIIYEASAKDGSRVNEIIIPVTVK